LGPRAWLWVALAVCYCHSAGQLAVTAVLSRIGISRQALPVPAAAAIDYSQLIHRAVCESNVEAGEQR